MSLERKRWRAANSSCASGVACSTSGVCRHSRMFGLALRGMTRNFWSSDLNEFGEEALARGQQFLRQRRGVLDQWRVQAFQDVWIGFEGHDEEFLEFRSK